MDVLSDEDQRRLVDILHRLQANLSESDLDLTP
jgi:hypothetical protein